MKLPVMQCDSGCGECCGPVLCNEFEFARISRHIEEHNIKPVLQGTKCPFLQGGTCAVYEVRPWICRMFGHSEKMICCRGYNVNIHPDDERRHLRKYIEKGGEPNRFLHELACDWDTFEAILKASLEPVIAKVGAV